MEGMERGGQNYGDRDHENAVNVAVVVIAEE